MHLPLQLVNGTKSNLFADQMGDFSVAVDSATTIEWVAGDQVYRLGNSSDLIKLFSSLHLHCFSWDASEAIRVRERICRDKQWISVVV